MSIYDKCMSAETRIQPPAGMTVEEYCSGIARRTNTGGKATRRKATRRKATKRKNSKRKAPKRKSNKRKSKRNNTKRRSR